MEQRRLKQTNKDQIELLLDLMKKNPDIARGKPSFGSSKMASKEKWSGFAKSLNAIGPPTRSQEEWSRINIKTLHTFDTEFPADTVEWCPNEGYREYFACGTYNLEKDNAEISTLPCRRKGTIILLRFIKETKQFDEVYRCQTAAILDMKWLPSVENSAETESTVPTLATANALGQIDIYTLEEKEQLQLKASIECNSECQNLLALALDWDWPIAKKMMSTSNRHLLVSDSKGDISMFEYSMDKKTHKLEKLKTWQAHNFEAWICAFDKWDRNLAYTGGDDIMMHGYDLRSYERVLTNRSHAAGVTSLLSHSKREHMLLTGSYDERMRVFDTRSMRKPLAEIGLQGGIWRLKPDPLSGDLILAACMYKNFSFIRLPLPGSGEYGPQLVAVYNEHKSICYGADWCQDINKKDQESKDLYLATCSFYDNKLCVSNIEF